MHNLHCSGSYLKRSASVLRDSIVPALDHNRNAIDRDIRFVFTAVGPEYRHVDTVAADPALRRVRNLHCSQDFAQVLFQDSMLCNAKSRMSCMHS